MMEINQTKDILYQDDKYTLSMSDKGLTLESKGQEFALSSHYYEPCTYIEHDGFEACMHNAFDLSCVVSDIKNKRDISTYGYRDLTSAQFCELMIDTWLKQRSETKQEIAKELGVKTAKRR